MTRQWLGCLLACALCVADARAAGYDDFASGMSEVNRGDNDQAIAFFTSALAAGDLNARLVPVAYLERARAHMQKEECSAAVADAGAAIKLRPDYFEAFLLRATAEHCAGVDSDAAADLTQVIAARPVAGAYWQRALARWNFGDFQGAADDFSTAAAKSPNWAYPIIWFGLAKLRAGNFDGADFAKKSSSFDADDWPGPVLGLYAGKLAPDEVVAAAGKGDEEAAKNNTCEAQFYVAEWWLVQKKPEAARPLLEDARADCPHDFVEYTEALVELKGLK